MIAALGTLGAILVAAASHHVGTLALVPIAADAQRPGNTGAGRWICTLGVVILIGCWLLLGRSVRELRWQTLAGIAALWSAPLLAAAPFGSRDVWAYGGQADVYRHGFDPYVDGPAAFPSHYLPMISLQWRDQPSPYGPAWLAVAALLITFAGSHILVSVFATRVVCAVGFALVALTLPRLARTFGGSPAVATWLYTANPVIVVVCLAGPHNDLLMAGLLAGGLWLAVVPGPLWRSLVLAAVVLAVAAEIKLPAACALAFLPLIWLRYAPGARGYQLWRACAVVVAATAGTVVVIAAATGLGFGWVHQVNAGESGALWASAPLLAGYVRSGADVAMGSVVHDYPNLVTAVAIALAVVLVALWCAAVRHEPARLLAIALLVGVVVSTTVQPWYAAWALPVVAAVVTTRWVVLTAVTVTTFGTICLIPNGSSYYLNVLAVPIAAVSALAVLVANPAQPRVRSTSNSPSA